MAILDKASNLVIGLMEGFFYRWGKFVARRPYTVIIVTFVMAGLCCIGSIKMTWESDTNRLWIPRNSNYKPHNDWIWRNFQRNEDGKRGQVLIFKSSNVLKADNVREMYKLHAKIDEIASFGLKYKDICYRLPIADIFLDKKRRRKRQADDESSTTESASDYDYDYDYYSYLGGVGDDDNSTTSSLTHEEYLASIGIDYNDRDYNNFEGFQDTQIQDKGRKEISHSLPPQVYCNVIETLSSKCFESSLLEIWKYHKRTIDRLTDDDVINAIHVLKRSPYFGFGTQYASKLGSIERNGTHVIGAKSALHSWVTLIQRGQEAAKRYLGINLGDVDKVGFAWELEVVKVVEEQNKEWKEAGVDMEAVVNVARSFSDISNQAIFVDAFKMAAGYFLMFTYTALMLGRLNLVELRMWLGLSGMFSVGMGLGVSIGLSSAIGLPYTPLHAMLPFVCLGIGIDDMFVIVQCYNNLDPKKTAGLSLEERIGRTMKHAGVAITVTSLTDIFAFGVGAVTILPGLEAFCVSSAIGIGAIYILQASWFVAWLKLDQGRIEEKKNAVFPCCIKHGEDWQPSQCSQSDTGTKLIKKFAQLIDYKAFKAGIILLTLGLAGVGLYGSLNMVIVFEPEKLLPENTYLTTFLKVHKEQYPKDGWGADVYFSKLDPQTDLEKLEKVSEELRALPVLKGAWSWFDEMKVHIKEKYQIEDWRETIKLDENGFNPLNFSYVLSDFVFSARGANFKRNIVFDGEVKCNKPAPQILASKMGITYIRFNGPQEHVPGKRAVEYVVKKYNVTDKSFSHSAIYAAWETDEVIGKELWRNLGLAMACVAVITLLLLANLSICLMVLVCVVLTLVDLVGFLHFWGITIDTLSCVNIVLAVGLCIDYSAHIAHAFIVSTGTRNERAKNALVTMGPAIANGGITTFLALVFLGFSQSHIFITFFRVFLLTVIFGLFHGLIFLTTVLSIIGSKKSHEIKDDNSEDSSNGTDPHTSKSNSLEAPDEAHPAAPPSETSSSEVGSSASGNGGGKSWRPKWPKRFNEKLSINNP